MNLKELLRAVAAGEITPEAAEARFSELQVADMGFAALDLQREARRGRPEIVFCEHKTVEQLISIIERLYGSGQNVILTRLTAEQDAAVRAAFASVRMTGDPRARFLHLLSHEVPVRRGLVGVLAAGTSDLPIAEEAALTAEALGSPVERAYDVGVAGIHRLMRRAELLRRARVLVVIAGMEGALPSVVSGLTRAPVIAVPTSVGYGASLGGVAALLGMLCSCSPGVSVVNIDNGFGAGYLADQINELGDAP